MNLTEFLVEVRQRASGYPLPRSPEEAVVTLVGLTALPGPQADSIGVVLNCFLQPEEDVDIAFRHLANLGPLALAAVDQLTEGLLSGYYSERDLRKALGLEH